MDPRRECEFPRTIKKGDGPHRKKPECQNYSVRQWLKGIEGYGGYGRMTVNMLDMGR